MTDRYRLHFYKKKLRIYSRRIKKKRYMPTHVFINGFQAEGLDRHSIALCEQLCCVRYGDLMRQVGKVSTFQMLKITLGMQIQLGMVGKYNE